jgi:hypothetical protein
MQANGHLHTPALYPQGRHPLASEYEVEWAPKLIWTLQKRDKSLTPTEYQTTIPQLSGPQSSHYTNYIILALSPFAEHYKMIKHN